jgi:hypothetical protein
MTTITIETDIPSIPVWVMTMTEPPSFVTPENVVYEYIEDEEW